MSDTDASLRREDWRAEFDAADEARWRRKYPQAATAYSALKTVLSGVYEERFESYCLGKKAAIALNKEKMAAALQTMLPILTDESARAKIDAILAAGCEP